MVRKRRTAASENVATRIRARSAFRRRKMKPRSPHDSQYAGTKRSHGLRTTRNAQAQNEATRRPQPLFPRVKTKPRPAEVELPHVNRTHRCPSLLTQMCRTNPRIHEET